MKQSYLDAILLIERLHRQFLEVVKAELDRVGIEDINNVQSLILHNVGREELTVGELTNRGYYLGSNVSYNVKKMVENGYIVQERSAHDRRSVRIRVSEKGLKLCDLISELHDRHVASFTGGPITEPMLTETNRTLRQLERFWAEALAWGARQPPEKRLSPAA